MHVVFLCDGLPEGIKDFERQLDRHNFGNGGFPCRLREIKIYDLQFDSKDKKDVMAVLSNSPTEPKYEEKLAYKLEQKQNPFKKGMLTKLISLFIRSFGWSVGAKPWETWKEKNLPNSQIRKWVINTFPIAEIPDNFVFNKAHKTREEWL